MQENNLPTTFKGYSTERLLEVLRMRLSSEPLDDVPVDEIRAMNDLSREYRLSPIFKAIDLLGLKK